MKIQIKIIESNKLHTKIVVIYNNTEYKFDISNIISEEDVIRLATNYITIKENI